VRLFFGTFASRGLFGEQPAWPGGQDRRRELKGVGTYHVPVSAEFSGGGRKGLDLGLQDPGYEL
jgi:hypothetical protein